jgi:hypothetical protein
MFAFIHDDVCKSHRSTESDVRIAFFGQLPGINPATGYSIDFGKDTINDRRSHMKPQFFPSHSGIVYVPSPLSST